MRCICSVRARSNDSSGVGRDTARSRQIQQVGVHFEQVKPDERVQPRGLRAVFSHTPLVTRSCIFPLFEGIHLVRCVCIANKAKASV